MLSPGLQLDAAQAVDEKLHQHRDPPFPF